MNTKIIKLDINKRLYETAVAKQGDTESRFLLFNLLDGAVPFNLTNRSVRVYGIKPDNKELFNDLIINNAEKGYCTLELTNQVLAVPGIVKLELVITEGTKKLSSIPFCLEVIKSINNENAVVSTNEFTALLNALASLNEYDNYKNEIKAARDGEVNLLTKVKKIDASLEQNTSYANITSKAYIKSNGSEDESENINAILNLLRDNVHVIFDNSNTFKCKKSIIVRKNGLILNLNKAKFDFSECTDNACFVFDDNYKECQILNGEIFSLKTKVIQGIQFGTPNGSVGHIRGIAKNNTIYNMNDHGILAYGGSNGCLFEGNYVHDTRNGISVMEGAGNCTIAYNFIERWYDGADIDGVYHHIHGIYVRGHGHNISNNICRNGGGMGINVNADGSKTTGQITISNNIIYGCRDGGINAFQNSDCIITGNHIFLCRTKDIALIDAVLDKYGVTNGIIDLKVWNTAEYDYNSTTKGIINIWSNTNTGTDDVRRNVIISDNKIEDCYTVEAIRINDSSVSHNTINNIQISNNIIDCLCSHGIRIVNVPVVNCNISNNIITRCHRTLEILCEKGIIQGNILSGGVSTNQYLNTVEGDVLIISNEITVDYIANVNATYHPSALYVQKGSCNVKDNYIDISKVPGTTSGTSRNLAINCLSINNCEYIAVTGNTFKGTKPRSDHQNLVVYRNSGIPHINGNTFMYGYVGVWNARNEVISGSVSFNTFEGVRTMSDAPTTANAIKQEYNIQITSS